MNKQIAKDSKALIHPFQPVIDLQSRVLVLGSFPSVKSRENEFYYGHPQNRFWKLLAILLSKPQPITIQEKVSFLHRNHIAVWDVVKNCDIVGSADSTLAPNELNDIPSLLSKADIRIIFANGAKAGKLYQRNIEPITGLQIRVLPSTSPANAAWSLQRLVDAWQPLLDSLFENRLEHEEHL